MRRTPEESHGAATTMAIQCETARPERGTAAALGAADWLSLAAAPTFAVMALATGVLGGGASDMTMCPAEPHASPLTGMASMYVLMSAFHAAPWLRLISRRRAPVLDRPTPQSLKPDA